MVRTKTCSTVFQRQSLDTGTGKIHVPSNYGAGNTDNDDCDEVYTHHDCPTGYRLLRAGKNPYKDHGHKRSNGTRVSDDTLKTKNCWRGGNTHGRGTHAVKGMTHGIHGTFYHDSNKGSGKNNYAKVCFKDNGGWDMTNPTNGTKTHPQSEYNADACCGFIETVRRDVKEHYCKTNTCFKMENDKTKDILSKVCQDRLVDKCKNWSFVPDTVGFEDDRCATPIIQIAKQKQTSVSQLSPAQSDEAEQARQTASIDDNNYRDYGEKLCTNQVFLDESDSGPGFEKKQKCIQWCRNNPNQCRTRIKGVCATIYEKSKALPNIYPDAIKENNNICACHWPKEFYENILEFFEKKYNVATSQVVPDRKCLYRPCSRSDITNEGPLGDSFEDCPDQTLISCVQNLNIDFQGAHISDGAQVNTGQEQACGSLSDTAVDASRRPTRNDSDVNEDEGGSSDPIPETNEDDSGIISSFVIFIIILVSVIAAVIIYLK
jgi:hypothetical protein